LVEQRTVESMTMYAGSKKRMKRRGGTFRTSRLVAAVVISGLALQQLHGMYLSISLTATPLEAAFLSLPTQNSKESFPRQLPADSVQSVEKAIDERTRTTPERSSKINSVVLPKKKKKPKGFEKITTVFSRARKDRSGAAILHHLMGHAFAFAHGMDYGGVCGNTTDQVQELIGFLGLVYEIPLGPCPAGPDHHLFPEFNYNQFNGTSIFSEEWRRIIQSRIAPFLPKTNSKASNDVLEVAVHVRRGDVRRGHWWRYLPDRHYLEILDTHLQVPTKKNTHVTVYSESKCRCFGAYSARNYTLNLDGNLTDVWRAMMQSDVLILSKSDFSMVPALLGRSRVLYTPFIKDPLPGWEIISPNITERTEQEMKPKS